MGLRPARRGTGSGVIASAAVMVGLTVWQSAVWIWIGCMAIIAPSVLRDPECKKARELTKFATHLGACTLQLYLIHVLRTAWTQHQDVPLYLLIAGCLVAVVFMVQRRVLRVIRKMEASA